MIHPDSFSPGASHETLGFPEASRRSIECRNYFQELESRVQIWISGALHEKSQELSSHLTEMQYFLIKISNDF